MKRIAVRIVVLLGFGLAAGSADAAVIFNDGLVHEIATDLSHQYIDIYDGPTSEPTIVKLWPSGAVGETDVYQNSLFIMLGGRLRGGLYLHDYSQGEISGGIVDEDPFGLSGFSQLTITGGDISEGFWCVDNSQVFIYGGNFRIDDVPVGYGPVTATSGLLTGDLIDGGQLRSSLVIRDKAVITLLPEPGTILLLGLGALGALRNRRSR